MKLLIIVLVLLFLNNHTYAHYSLKQHSIVHYYPSLEKKFFNSNCRTDLKKRKICKIIDKDIKKNTSK